MTPRLGELRIVTITAPDLVAIEKAYRDALDYQVVWRGVISEALARSWAAPAVVGRRVLLMGPKSQNPTYFRFVEQAPPDDYRPLTTYGWNAAEIAVQDVDLLAARLEGGPFQVIGPPRALTGFPGIKAMQVVGPGREVLYFTHRRPPPDAPPSPWAPKSFVDYCFVAILGAADITAAGAYYEQTFANPPGKVFKVQNAILSKAHGMAVDTPQPLAIVRLGGPKLIEIDAYPPTAKPRLVPDGGLPPGIAMVSFEHGRLSGLSAPMFGPVAMIDTPPYHGHRAATVIGQAGERIELLESAA